jgi:hypothetical protein
MQVLNQMASSWGSVINSSYHAEHLKYLRRRTFSSNFRTYLDSSKGPLSARLYGRLAMCLSFGCALCS